MSNNQPTSDKTLNPNISKSYNRKAIKKQIGQALAMLMASLAVVMASSLTAGLQVYLWRQASDR